MENYAEEAEENIEFSEPKKELKAGDMRMVAKTMTGFEEILGKELLRLGARDIEPHRRAVSFTGDKGTLYKANLCLRTALRVLVPVNQFEVRDEQELYDRIKEMEWEQWLGPDDTLAVNCSLNTRIFNHSQFISQKTKDAIVDRFREKYGRRPSVDLNEPTLRISLHIHENNCSVFFDSSGDSLHKRGYRDLTGQAPLNEVLAAGMILLSGWEKHRAFLDPMCGSGTLVIEAALIANNVPPGIFRPKFGFETWKDFDAELWETIHDGQLSRISEDMPQIFGSDMSAHVLRKAKENVHLARVEDVVKLTVANFHELEPPALRGTMILNPPYGERMNKEDITLLYKNIGDTFKKRFAGWDAWILSSNMEALKNIGLRPSRKIALHNGALDCKFMKFELYEGTKKVHKLREGGE